MVLDKPAHSGQLRRSLKEMGLVANLLVPTNLHALRNGAASDVAHLPAASNGAGLATHEVRQFLNHSNKAFAHGITEDYVGDVTWEFWNARVESPYQSVWTSRLSNMSAVDVVQKSVSAKEIAEWQTTHKVPIADRNSKSAQDTARHHLRQERHMHFRATATPEKRKKQGSSGSKVMATANPEGQ